ncbi:cytochrome P450 family protein [Cavenderia fasciculata]|uniref:Cytochrome P450 family protein n=1 Tax=Cavenderia fasciculata TaxID=261658 RepID=F4PPR8_CACFS|nr:cytochrome P450 family protein [Cavenderia fasciculata]EGG22381.1 cytochrome P450 family protein [Cavenderia fasciculata]|eukprot:XP_004360232.1 cytochrome P450 family protein [Cavenderia fasciculata]
MESQLCPVKAQTQKDCQPACVKYQEFYNGCSQRIEKLVDDEKANCLGQYLEYIQCVDKCNLSGLSVCLSVGRVEFGIILCFGITYRMPPGPFPLPVIGNLHQMGKHAPKSLKQFSDKYGGLTTIFLGSVPTVVVSDPALIKELIVDRSEEIIDRFNSDSAKIIGEEKNLLFAKGPYWKKYRKVFTTAMTKARSFNIASRIEAQAVSLNRFFGTFATSGQLLSPHVYIRRYSLNGVIDYSFTDAVDYESENEHVVIRAAEIMEDLLATGNPQDFIPILKPVFNSKRVLLANTVGQVWSYCQDAIDLHKKTLDREKPRDMLDVLLIEMEKSEDSAFFESQDDSLAKCLTDLIIAGHETVATTLGWMIIFLVNNPDIQERAYQELINVVGKGNLPQLHHRNATPYLNAIIKETMRIRTPAPLALPRCAVNDIEIGGYVIPKNTQVLMAVYGMAMDENHFEKPEVFNPDRWVSKQPSPNSLTDYAYIPFGVGPRMCVGMGVAKDELYYIVSQMLINFKWSSPDGRPLDDEGICRVSLEYKHYQVRLEHR